MPTSLGSWYQECHWHYLTPPGSCHRSALSSTQTHRLQAPGPFLLGQLERLVPVAATWLGPPASPVVEPAVRQLPHWWPIQGQPAPHVREWSDEHTMAPAQGIA